MDRNRQPGGWPIDNQHTQPTETKSSPLRFFTKIWGVRRIRTAVFPSSHGLSTILCTIGVGSTRHILPSLWTIHSLGWINQIHPSFLPSGPYTAWMDQPDTSFLPSFWTIYSLDGSTSYQFHTAEQLQQNRRQDNRRIYWGYLGHPLACQRSLSNLILLLSLQILQRGWRRPLQFLLVWKCLYP